MSARQCCYCDATDELRPYGPKGALVCFPCAMSSPEREEEARQNFASQLSAAGELVIIGSDVGPYPASAHRP